MNEITVLFMCAAIVVSPAGLWPCLGASGTYTLSGLPPASYALVAWLWSADDFIILREAISLAEGFVILVNNLDYISKPKARSIK